MLLNLSKLQCPFLFFLFSTIGSLSMASENTIKNDRDMTNWIEQVSSQQEIYIMGKIYSSKKLEVFTPCKKVNPEHRGQAILTESIYPQEPVLIDKNNTSPDLTIEKKVKHMLIKNQQLKQLLDYLSKVDWQNKVVVQHEYLCDAPSREIHFSDKSQSVINLCGTNDKYPKISNPMKSALEILDNIEQQTN